MIKVKDGYAKLIGTTYSGSASRVLLSNGGDHVLGNASGNIPLNNGTVNTNLNADTVDGLHIHTGRNSEANKLVRTDASGYIQAGWINTTSGNFTGTPDRIYASNDAYVRYMTPANFLAKVVGNNYWKVNNQTTAGSGDIYLEFWRGTNASWKILNTGGVLKFQSNYTSSAGSYYDCLTIDYNTGNTWIKGRVTAPGASIGGYSNTSYALSTSSFICNSWVRTVGSSGWYNESHGGGWYMTDSSWIRNYNSKPLYISVGTYPSIVCNAQGGTESNIRFEIAGVNKGYTGYKTGYGTFLWNSTASKYVYINDSGHFYTQSYINVGAGNEKNASNPPYVWGVNGSDNFMRTYATSSLSVGNADYAISSPAAANWGTRDSTTKIKIKINSTTSWMLSFVVTLYQGYKSSKIMISGYNYGSNYWYEPEAVLLGDSNSTTSITVYFGYDSVNNLWVGFDGGSYTGVSVSDVTNGYTQISSLKGLFTISNVSSLTTLQKTVTATNSVNYAVSAGTSSNVVVNSSDSNSTYRMVWHSGNTLYGTNNIYCNPSTDQIYSAGFKHVSYDSSSYLLRSDGGAAAFNWSGQSGQPTWLWGGNSQHTYYVYNPSNFNVNSAAKLRVVSCYNGTTNNDLWSTIKSSNSSYLGTSTMYEVYNDGGPTTYGHVLDTVTVHSNHWQSQLWMASGKGGRLYYRNKDYNNDTWGDWKTVAWTTDTAPSVTVTNSDSNSTYRMVWHSGNNLYSTAGIYCNPSTDYLYASSMNASDWFRSSGNTGWYNPTNNCHVYPNATTTYGGLMFRGEKGGYTGFVLGTSNSYMNLMDNGTDKGLYQESNGQWILYYNRSSKKVGILTSTITKTINLAGSTYISSTLDMGGAINTASTPGSWVSGMSGAAIQYRGLAAIDASSFWRFFNMKSSGGHIVCYGGLGNDIGFYGYYSGRTANGTDWRFTVATASGNWTATASIYAAHFYENSDLQLKTNIQEILNSDKMPIIKEFNWKEDNSHSYGLIAQELEEQGYSELVSIKDDGYKTVNYSAALSLIVGKLQVKIKELEKEIEILKNKN